MSKFRYKAFISYSHRDRSWSGWLQRALESYRVPKRLVGTEGEFGPVPRRLTPVFRDREDLSSAADLSAKVKEALEASESMIVICSPAAHQSIWVNEEVRYFRSLGREERIFALIVDGDPQAEASGERCFPAALITDPDGTAHEPLAADTRKWADGKLLAKLKIVSGILGIRLDELRRRNLQRQRRNWAIAAVSTMVMILVTGTLTYTTLSSQKAARLQRASTEELLGYMLGNLKNLDPIVGLEVVDEDNDQIMEYLRTLGFEVMTNDQLVEKGMEWREQGIFDHDRRQLEEAMENFQKSLAAFIQLYQREGGTTRALFELGQAEFWIGYVFFDSGELDEAEERFVRYGAITRRLVNADPKNPEMVMELSYTFTNLGALERAKNNPDTEKSRQMIQSSLQYNQIALVLDPENDAYRADLSTSLAWMADAWLDSCDLGKALNFRQQNVELNRTLYDSDPDNQDYIRDLATSLSGLAAVQRRIPVSEQALANLKESHDLLSQLASLNSENPSWKWRVLMRQQRILQIRAWTESLEQLWPEVFSHKQRTDSFYLSGQLDDYETSVLYAGTLLDYSRLARLKGEAGEAGQSLQDAMNRLLVLVDEKPENRYARQLIAGALLEYWDRHGVFPGEKADGLLDGYLADHGQVTSCEDARLAAHLELTRNNVSRAKEFTGYLLDKGFYEPSFVAFCTHHALCANID